MIPESKGMLEVLCMMPGSSISCQYDGMVKVMTW